MRYRVVPVSAFQYSQAPSDDRAMLSAAKSAHDHAFFRLGRRMAVQHPARLAAGQLDHDQCAALSGVRQEGMPAVLREADVVQVGAGDRDVLAEADHLGHAVGGEIDAHQLRPPGHEAVHGRGGGVHYPDAAAAVGHHALDADPVVRRVELVGCIAPYVAPGIPLPVGIRPQAPVPHELGDRDGRVFRPARKIDEDAAPFADGHAGDLVFEPGHLLQHRIDPAMFRLGRVVRLRLCRRRPGSQAGACQDECEKHGCDSHDSSFLKTKACSAWTRFWHGIGDLFVGAHAGPQVLTTAALQARRRSCELARQDFRQGIWDVLQLIRTADSIKK
jgi:hypothetical protein